MKLTGEARSLWEALVPDFVGGDPESNASECPAVFVDPETGDFLFRGKTVTDPALITALNEHIGKAEDESDVWLPARMASLIRGALQALELASLTLEWPGDFTPVIRAFLASGTLADHWWLWGGDGRITWSTSALSA